MGPPESFGLRTLVPVETVPEGSRHYENGWMINKTFLQFLYKSPISISLNHLHHLLRLSGQQCIAIRGTYAVLSKMWNTKQRELEFL
jgi:hypothetical protein